MHNHFFWILIHHGKEYTLKMQKIFLGKLHFTRGSNLSNSLEKKLNNFSAPSRSK